MIEIQIVKGLLSIYLRESKMLLETNIMGIQCSLFKYNGNAMFLIQI